MMPDSKVPTVQPSATIAPQPISRPPPKERAASGSVGMRHLKSPADAAAPKAPSTSATTKIPLLDHSASFTTVAQPRSVSSPSMRVGKMWALSASVRATLPSSAVTPSGAIRK